MRRAMTALFVAIVAVAAVHAQTPPMPTFEAAIVKPSDPAAQGQTIRRQPGGRFSTSNMPIREIVRFAYQMQDFQLDGMPEWAATARYDITAKMAGDPPMTAPGTVDDMVLSLRALLAERFKLQVHKATKELPMYALVRLRADRLGAHLEPSRVDCEALMRDVLAAARVGGGSPQPPPPDEKGRPTCGIGGTGMSLVGGGFGITELANVLAQRVGRTVVDRTGLAGAWAFDLKFAPDVSRLPPGAPPPPVDPDSPSIFTAVEEQLGLKLESTRGPVEVLVIDRLERPIPD